MSGSDKWLSNGNQGIKNRPQLHKTDPAAYWVEFVADAVVAVGLLLVLAYVRDDEFGQSYRIMSLLTVFLIWFFYNNLGIYESEHNNNFDLFMKLVKGWSLVVFCLVILGFMSKTSGTYSRQVILSWVPITFFLHFTVHVMLPEFLRKFHEPDVSKEPALVIGATGRARHLCARINNNPWLPVKIVGVVDDSDEILGNWDMPGIKPMGGIKDLDEIIKKHNIGCVYIAYPMAEAGRIEKLYIDLHKKNIDINWMPDAFGITLVDKDIKEISGVPILPLSEIPLSGTGAMFKSLIDKIVAGVAIVLLSPVLLATAMAIKIESPGPVLFKQKRHGWHVSIFEIWKFRSMRVHQETEGEVTQATKEDPRVTKVGKFIRKTSIDELPQLFNVLQGNMSMVGPRPHAVEHNDHYGQIIDAFFSRHRIRPGITGLAQVNGFRGETETVEKMKKRLEYDMKYIHSWSLLLDFKIMVQTIFVLFSKNAY